jgi:[histone H3]-lysine36 N-trimethyltransferase
VKQDSEGITTPENIVSDKAPRKPSQKMATRGAPLFDHLADATEESLGHFQVIHDCLYGSRNIGSSDNDALDCDCAEEWRKSAPTP